jgi:biotin transport system substrate-specific component
MTGALSLTSPRRATIDALREEYASTLTQVLGIVGFALLTALGAQYRIYLWEVPISLQTMVVYGSGLYLGWRNGLLSQVLYISLGLLFPVFAGEGMGIAYFYAAASAGYIVAYPLAAAAIGYLSREWKTFAGSSLSMLLGAAIIFTIGVTWLHFAAGHATWLESLDKGFFRFVLIDAAKIALLALVYAGSRQVK